MATSTKRKVTPPKSKKPAKAPKNAKPPKDAKAPKDAKTPKDAKPAKAPKPVRTVIEGLPFDPTSPTLPRGLRRFGAQLDRARAALGTSVAPEAHGVDALRAQALYRANLRTPLFMLEGLSRLALGTGGDPDVFEPLQRDVKVIEDTLGEVDYWWVVADKARGWNLPAEFLRHVEEQHRVACGRVMGWLEARAWVDHRYLPQEGEVRLRVNRIGRDLVDTRWLSDRKERRALAEFLHGRALSTERAARSLDMADIEHGLHELRRRLRWLSIYATALDGSVQLDQAAKAPKGWAKYMTPAVVNNPFNALPKGDPAVVPVTIPAPLFYALSWLIAELGALKDRAQWTEAVTHGLAASGLTGKPKQWMGDIALEDRDAGKLASALVAKTLIEDKLMVRLAEALEAQV